MAAASHGTATSYDFNSLHDLARAAERSGDWVDAANWWALARANFANIRLPYTAEAAAYVEIGRLDDAERLLNMAAERFPEEVDPLIDLARLLQRRGDWQGALRMWNKIKQQFPTFDNIDRLMAVAQFQLAVTQTTDISRIMPGDEIGNFLMNFESLGGDCEFAHMQRYYGAEPISLFRWAGITPDRLAAALDDRCRGIGDPLYTQINIEPSDQEYRVSDPRYFHIMHTHVRKGEEDEEKLLLRLRRFLKRLASDLMDSIEEGSQIFVYRTPSGDITDDQILMIADAIHRINSNAYLVVGRCFSYDSQIHQSPSEIRPRVIVGPVRLGGPARTSWDDWIVLCRFAVEFWQVSI